MRNAFIILLFVVQVDGRVQLLGIGHCVVYANGKDLKGDGCVIDNLRQVVCYLNHKAGVLLLRLI